MNQTIDLNTEIRVAAKATSPARINELAAAAVKRDPPLASDPYDDEITIARIYKRLLDGYPYFGKETRASFWLMIGCLVIAIAVPLILGFGMAGAAVTSIAAVSALIGAHRWYFHNWGPAIITPERYAQAHQQLLESGDNHISPLRLVALVTLVAIMLVDGFLSGNSLMTSSIFANLFTPRWALLAAIMYSMGITYCLFKIVMSAAQETAIADRRTLIRNLSKSANQDDRDLAQKMKAAVGGVLLHDFDSRSNKISAHVGLACAIVILAVATFVMRTDADSATTKGGDAAPVSQAAQEAATKPE